MEDENIVALYWQRNEEAIVLTQEQHGAVCFAMANRILNSAEDSEECVNDTWLHAWRAMPPARPCSLLAEREAWRQSGRTTRRRSRIRRRRTVLL